MPNKQRNVSRSSATNDRLLALLEMAQMQIAKADERMARNDERMARNDERYLELQQEIKEHVVRTEQMAATVFRMLEKLPEAVRETIGFRHSPA